VLDRLWTPWRLAYVTEASRPTSECIFCDALKRDEPLVAHRGQRVFVILNKFPYNNGHLMVVPDRHVWPVSPPPEIDLDAWERTIDEIEQRAPERLALIHFGVVEQPRDHLRRLRRQLRVWAQRVRQGMDQDEFVEAARADLEDDIGEAAYYERAAPLWQSYLGLRRYWEKLES